MHHRRGEGKKGLKYHGKTAECAEAGVHSAPVAFGPPYSPASAASSTTAAHPSIITPGAPLSAPALTLEHLPLESSAGPARATRAVAALGSGLATASFSWNVISGGLSLDGNTTPLPLKFQWGRS